MSKIAIISDIHGNIEALDEVLKDINNKGIKQIYCLGDLVGYYCFYNEVVKRIEKLKIPTIMGNHDDAIVNKNGIIERSKTCTKILNWQLDNILPETLNFLKNLPIEMTINHSGKSIYAVHAGLNDNIDEYLFDVNEDYFKKHNFNHDILLTGHTHLLVYKKFYNGKIWLNPGSVGQSRDMDNRASYLVIDNEFNIEFVRVPYNFMKIVNAMKENGFDDYISETLITGKKIGL